MSTPPRGLALTQQERYSAAVTAAARILGVARTSRDELYAREGAGAVARTAHAPGDPDVEEIAALYERLRRQAEGRRRREQ